MDSGEINNDLLINPGVDIGEGSQELLTMARIGRAELKRRWAAGHGNYVLVKWRASGFQRQVLDGLVGKFYGQTDLRGIDLSEADLNGVDLSYCDMFSASLQNANLSKANLNHTWLSETDLRGANLSWASMDGVLIDNADFNNRTTMLGVNLAKVDFTLAWPLRSFAFNQQRIADLKSRYPFFAKFLEITTDYGRSFPRFFGWCLVTVVLFALAFSPDSMISEPGFWNGLYYSAATFTSLGANLYAVSPMAKVLSVVEVFLGYVMLGLLATMIAKRVLVD
ncbi:MAG: pentapeptide repeat-containing protein [Tildeniella torsiva UHER 1998/13D]|jgi:hypothetical protein|nr:pentapeptide repeat-containing protein [Tildeniella torsiva UHER 1998/13D]